MRHVSRVVQGRDLWPSRNACFLNVWRFQIVIRRKA